MKPKVTCRSCGAEIEWNVNRCPSCGTMVEWPKQDRQKPVVPNEKSAASAGVPLRNIVAVVVIIGLGVVLMEYFSGSGSVPQGPAQQGDVTADESGADMSALPHIEELEAQLADDPANQSIRRDLGNHLMDARFYHRAVDTYRSFLERDPADPDVRVDLGICYKELGDLDAAETEMRTALTYSPKHLHAHFNLGIVKLVKGELEESTEWFKKTAELDPDGELGKRAQQLIDQHLSVRNQ